MKVKDILKATEPQWLPNEKYDSTQPKVTVILPTFRRAKSGHFEKAVESVMNQTFKEWELIIVDDASVDGTFDLIKFYMEQDNRINCIRHTYNLGLPSISEYEAYVKARGEYIAFIFDDNVWNKEHLMLSMKAMIKNGAKFTYGVTRSYYTGGYIDIALDLNLLPYTNVLGNGAVVVHKDIIETVGLYDPHVTVTRLCDWDLWRRISKKYRLCFTDEISTEEHGTGLNDSLGNTVPMNSWISAERMAYDRNEKLLPKNYPDCEINDIEEKSTELFKDYTKKYYCKYQKKQWFKDEIKDIPDCKKEPKRRLLLVMSGIDATYTLSLEPLSDYIIPRITICSPAPKDLVLADAVVFFRDLRCSEAGIKICTKNNIPAFYYIDDNFIEISKDSKDFEGKNIIVDMAKHINRSELKSLRGIITSTQRLKEYFIENDLHDNVEVIHPCADVDSFKCSPAQEMINIGFMGGRFREKVFIDKIFPAIIELSKEKKIKLICTDTLASLIKDNYNITSNIKIVEIKRDPCYDQAMCKFKEENINILIHPGEEIENNKYKTLNALINAVQLDAVLLTSEIEPYIGNDAIITVKNDKESWYKALKRFASDEKAREKQYEISCNYFKENYSVDVVGKTFGDIIKDVVSVDNATIIDRYEWLLSNVKSSDTSIAAGNISNDFIDNSLCYAELREKPSVYKINSGNISRFSKIGFVFSSDGICSGVLKAEIFIGGSLIAQSELQCSNINYRQVNYFDFKKDIAVSGKIKVKLSASYTAGSDCRMGVYLNARKKTLMYKILKKGLSVDLPITNLIYFELR